MSIKKIAKEQPDSFEFSSANVDDAKKCYEACLSEGILKDYNLRLPVFMAERYTSYWITKFSKRSSLSFARLGNFHLSNIFNSFMNTSKAPLTFRQYPTLYKF